MNNKTDYPLSIAIWGNYFLRHSLNIVIKLMQLAPVSLT